ncbi:GEVED domain-containing protein [Tellurirhabdus bombi]|uniref:GEVED domain-containing protein n=1 Tax=Tellurirhabdus bombi TaxID=2907205 RepID=UPI001F1DB10C|nr:GEVED domain-containing protein [Tellurirhabdus bombi]
MKKLYWIWLLIYLVAKQTSLAQSYCGTPAQTPQKQEQINAVIARLKGVSAKSIANGAITYVPVKVHFIRRSDGSGGADVARLLSSFAGMNARFLVSGIQFFLVGPPTLINNDNFYDFNWETDYNELVTTYRLATAANLFIPGRFTIGGYEYGGYGSDHVFLTASNLSPALLTHEFGHHFSLAHPYESVTGRELVARTNCTTAGDQLCDTPADPWDLPGGSSSDDGTCTYKGTVLDPQGNPYQPMMDNVMSGWACSRSAASRFTAGQNQRMADYLAYRLQNPSPDRNYTFTPGPTTAPTALTVTTANGQAVLTWQDNTGNAAGYLVEKAISTPDAFTAIGGVVPTERRFVDPNVRSNTDYYYRIRPANTRTEALSNQVQYNPGTVYCVPAYFQPFTGSTSTAYNGIDGVTLRDESGQTLLSNINTGIAVGSYTDYSTRIQSATLTAGSTYSITLTGKYQIVSQQNVAVWIDLNRDGVFSASERILAPEARMQSGSVLTLSFTVPTSLSAGPSRLRVRTSNLISPDPSSVADPCSFLYGNGEAEDYAVTLRQNCQLPSAIASGTGTINPGQAGQIAIALTESGPWSLTLAASNGERYPLTANQNQLYLSLSPTQTTTYWVTAVQNACGTGVSSGTATITVRTSCPPPTAVISGGATINPGQGAALDVMLTGMSPLSLTLTGSNGEFYPMTVTINRFTLSVSPTTTTTYQISGIRNTCGRGTTSGSATITVRTSCPPPTATISGNATIVQGQSAPLTVALTGDRPYSLTLTNSSGENFPITVPINQVSINYAPTQTTTYWVRAVRNTCGYGTTTGTATITVLSSASSRVAARASAGEERSNEAMAMQVYPNPAIRDISVDYLLREGGPLSIVLLNPQGREVKKLLEEAWRPAGPFIERFDLAELPEGFYFLHLQTAKDRQVQKIVISR